MKRTVWVFRGWSLVWSLHLSKSGRVRSMGLQLVRRLRHKRSTRQAPTASAKWPLTNTYYLFGKSVYRLTSSGRAIAIAPDSNSTESSRSRSYLEQQEGDSSYRVEVRRSNLI